MDNYDMTLWGWASAVFSTRSGLDLCTCEK